MLDKSNRLSIKLKGGTRENSIATMLKVTAVVIWILGAIAGFIVVIEGSFSSAVIVWPSSGMSGLLLYSLGEILSLLQKISTTDYEAEIVDDSAPTEEKKDEADDTNKGNGFFPYVDDRPIPFQPTWLQVSNVSYNKAGFRLFIKWDKNEPIKGILTDIIVGTIFGEKFRVENITFLNFHKVDNDYCSDLVSHGISESLVKSLQYVQLNIKKYVYRDGIYEPGDMLSEDYPNGMSAMDYLEVIKNCKTSMEVYNYTLSLKEKEQLTVPEDLLTMLSECDQNERMYGSSYFKTTVSRIKQYFGIQ